MSGKIYLVTNGSYSDYHVVAAFTDESKARGFAERATSEGYDRDYRVEECEDGADMELGLLPFHVWLFAGKWECEFCERSEFGSGYDGGDMERCRDNVFDYTRKTSGYLKSDQPQERADFFMLAKDSKTALKIAHERYGAVKAMPPGTVDDEEERTFPDYRNWTAPEPPWRQ